MATLDFQEKKKVAENQVKISIGIDASSLSAIFLRVRGENKISAWSFGNVPDVFNNTYFISVGSGLSNDRYKFDITVESLKNYNDELLIDVTFVSLIYDAEQSYTKDFEKLLKRFPDWTFPVHGIASVTSYVI